MNIREDLETRMIEKFLEITKNKITSFTTDDIIEKLLDYIDDLEYQFKTSQ